MAHVFGPLPPTWETRVQFLAPGFILPGRHGYLENEPE